jgi:precorrin-2 dehydrogenase/sirohydrochlorin ferrochelatase
MRYYPLFMDLAGRACLVVGAGAVAARKARSLLDCGARVTVVGVQPAAAFRALERRGAVVRNRRFRAGDVGRQALVIAATDDRDVNAAVAGAARRKGIPVNAVDDPQHCSFIVPAVVTRGDLTVAISTGGKSPAAARLVKERIAEVLGDEYAALVRLLGGQRGKMKDAVAGQTARARTWKRMIDAGVLEALRKGDRADAAKIVRTSMADAASAGRRGGASGGPPPRMPRLSGPRSDRGPNETVSTQSKAFPLTSERMVESAGGRSDHPSGGVAGRTPQTARERRSSRA